MESKLHYNYEIIDFKRTGCEGNMSYYFSKKTNLPFEVTVEKTLAELKNEGFGILTEIDVQATLKSKLGVEFYPYRILGACNPPFAYRALQAEDKIGAMLPCNVIVQEKNPGEVEISAVDPVASMQAVKNSSLEEISREVGRKLRQVLEKI